LVSLSLDFLAVKYYSSKHSKLDIQVLASAKLKEVLISHHVFFLGQDSTKQGIRLECLTRVVRFLTVHVFVDGA